MKTKQKTRTRKKPARAETAPFDPSQPLKSSQQEAFCQNMVAGDEIIPGRQGKPTYKGRSATKAYEDAGYSARGKVAEASASRLLLNVKIRGRTEYLRQQQAQMLAERGVATKEEVCQMLTSMMRCRHSDFLTMGEDGVTMYDIGPETLNQAALKKIKTRIQRDEAGNTVIERQFDEIELESKIAAAKALADLLGWNQADKTAGEAVANEKTWLDNLLAIGGPIARTPQTG